MSLREAAALAVVADLLVAFGVLLPLRAGRLIAALRERIANDPSARLAFYLRYPWFAAAAVVVFAAVVALGGHGAAAAGAGWPAGAGARLVPAAIGAVAAFGLVLGEAYAFGHRRDPAAFDPARQYALVEFLVPHTRRERAVWPLVCVAIAVLEELLYRGLFVLYAATLTGISAWWLVVPTSVVFGAGHRYQGWLGMVLTGGLGLSFAILAVGTGSLWPPIVLHALADYRLRFVTPPAPARPPPAEGSAPPPPPPG